VSAPATAFVFAHALEALPEAVRVWLSDTKTLQVCVHEGDDLLDAALRSRPRVAVFDARAADAATDAAIAACRRLKQDSFTGIVPAVVLVASADAVPAAFAAGADEVLTPDFPALVVRARLEALLRRSDRDVHVHPSTRLPGAVEIETEIGARLQRKELFAVCYADLDHFKEYNDRYSYYDGDRVIRILSKILHDVVKGTCGESGFVGHIGGDDFIFIMPLERLNETCVEIVQTFDRLVPFQYSEQDRRSGYYFGKDRRGQLHKVPLMTVSIGVVTNERRRFTHPSQISELATEMKSYAKSLAGSVFSVDRRGDTPQDGQLSVQRSAESQEEGGES
jgi:diguanylate cyclase (GGDEF)-like protein